MNVPIPNNRIVLEMIWGKKRQKERVEERMSLWCERRCLRLLCKYRLKEAKKKRDE